MANFSKGFDKNMLDYIKLEKKHIKSKTLFFDIYLDFAIIEIHCF